MTCARHLRAWEQNLSFCETITHTPLCQKRLSVIISRIKKRELLNFAVNTCRSTAGQKKLADYFGEAQNSTQENYYIDFQISGSTAYFFDAICKRFVRSAIV